MGGDQKGGRRVVKTTSRILSATSSLLGSESQLTRGSHEALT